MFPVEIAPGDIDPKRLRVCQPDTASDRYAQAAADDIL
jgi:hypothetical protein